MSAATIAVLVVLDIPMQMSWFAMGLTVSSFFVIFGPSYQDGFLLSSLLVAIEPLLLVPLLSFHILSLAMTAAGSQDRGAGTGGLSGGLRDRG